VRRGTRRVLERAGFTVIEAANGREAVDLFGARGSQLALIILDVTMPVMGGAEAFQKMRAIGPSVPVLVSSGYDQSDTIASFTGDDVAFLQKPYKPDGLMRRVREILATATTRAE
jgi:two-component system cell cycle sensor histidine kinase/response regulator CckA